MTSSSLPARLASSASELARLIRSGAVTSEALVSAHLERIAAVNPRINAVVQLRSDAALADARTADRLLAGGAAVGPLHGVPITVKDSFDTAGLVTTAGTPSAVVRVGATATGLPIGVQCVARPWREDVALRAAAHLEAELGGWQPPPGWPT